MLVMDGWQIIERIILYVVSFSINNTDIDKVKSLSSVENYLVKPINIDVLEVIFRKSA